MADAARATLDAPNPVYDANRARMAFVRDGNVFVRDLRSGALSQLSRSNAAASRPQFAIDGGLIWRVGNDWYHWSTATGTVQALSLAKSPRKRSTAWMAMGASSAARLQLDSQGW